MPSFVFYGNGTRTKFEVPGSSQPKTVKVNGSLASLSSQAAESVTLTAAPANGAVVEVSYDFDAADPKVVHVIAQGGVAASSASTSEVALANVTIPGGLLGQNGCLRVTTVWSYPNNANTKTLRVKFGGVAYLSNSPTTAATAFLTTIIKARGAGSQVGPANTGTSGNSNAAVATGSTDTTQDQTLAFTAQSAVGTDTITLEMYVVEWIPG